MAKKPPKKPIELDVDLQNALDNSDSLPARIELYLIQIIRELKKK